MDLQRKIRLCYYEGKSYKSEVQNDSFKAQHTFKLNNAVYYQTGSKEAYLLVKANQKQKLSVSGLPAEFDRIFNEETPSVFSNETGTFLYAAGKLFQYNLLHKSIKATLIFENLPCIGVVNVMQERTTGDFLISTKSAGFFRVKKKKFSVINLTGTKKDSADGTINTNNNIVYALNFWDNEQIFYNGYLTPVSGRGPSRYFDSVIKARFNYYFQYPKDNLNIWLNFDDSLQSFNKKTGRYTPLIKLFNPKKIIELSNGTALIVTAAKIISFQNNKLTELYKNDQLQFNSAGKLSENCLAVGTQNGIYYFYLAAKKLVPVNYKKTLKVRYIFKDKAGRTWFTTYGQGLYFLSGQKITSLPVDNSGYLNTGHSIFEDNRGYFWIPTNHGLFKVKYSSLLAFISDQSSRLYYIYFDKTDGFNTNEFNGGCFPSYAYKKETGLLFLPSMDGIVKFCPDSIQNISSESDIFFDQIVLNDTGHIYKVTNNLFFPKQTSSFRLQFSSPYYGHKENIKFSYKVNNVQEQWKDLEDLHSIVLNNLSGGIYTITIKREDANGVPLLARLQFKIQKNFTESFLFIVLLSILIVGLVYLFFRTRLHHLEKERLRLEKEVAARTADQMSLIAHKEKIIAVLIHDIKSPLYFLNSVAAHLNKNINQNKPDKNKELSNGIATSLNSLYLLTQDFSIWLNASQPGHIQAFDKVDPGKIIEEALEIYKEIIEKKELTVRRFITTKFIYGDEPMIKSVIRNLIDNAIKNTIARSITIRICNNPVRQICEIIIADEGKGMTTERIDSLNTFFHSNLQMLFFSTSGFGHKVIKDFLDRLGGEIFYRQNQPTGIKVTVHLRIPNALHKD